MTSSPSSTAWPTTITSLRFIPTSLRTSSCAPAKSTLETLCRYLHYRLSAEGTSVNVVRTRFVDTASLADTFGPEFAPFVRQIEPDVLSTPQEVADAIVGVCSGLMDALGGQVLTVDRGAGLYENFSRLYQERDVHPIVTRRQP